MDQAVSEADDLLFVADAALEFRMALNQLGKRFPDDLEKALHGRL